MVTIITINYKLPDPSASQENQPPPAFQATPGNRIRVSSGVMAGAIISRGADPVYPPEAKSAGIQGSVVLQAVISKTGDVTTLDPISGPEELRASAMEAVRQWTYRPFLLNGEPQEVSTTITVNFSPQLEDSTLPPPFPQTHLVAHPLQLHRNGWVALVLVTAQASSTGRRGPSPLASITT